MANESIIVIGDLHFPWVKQAALNRIYEAIKIQKPKYVVQIGDLYDQYAFSKYTKEHDMLSSNKELSKGRKMAETMWEKIRSLSPKSQCYQLLGNHDLRLLKRVKEKVPEASFIIQEYYNRLYAFDNVTSMGSDRDELYLDGMLFIHGYLSKLGDHCKKNLAKTVVGHSHTGGTSFYKIRSNMLWELNCGYVADEKAGPLQYGQQRSKNWTLGYGLITKINGIWCPQFVPIKLDK